MRPAQPVPDMPQSADTFVLWRDGPLIVDDLDRARYISLTTFKRDGSLVSTPVWITGTAPIYVFTTGEKAWKTRRLSRNSSVQVQVCDMRGRVKPNAAQYLGTGDVATSLDAVAAAERALSAKYGWQFKATKVVDSIKDRLSRADPQTVVAVRLSLTES